MNTPINTTHEPMGTTDESRPTLCPYSQVKVACHGGDCRKCLTKLVAVGGLCEVCGADKGNYREMMGRECSEEHGIGSNPK